MNTIESHNTVDRCLRFDEVCERLGVSRSSLYRLIKTKKLAQTRFGHIPTIRESVVAEFIESHTERPPGKQRTLA